MLACDTFWNGAFSVKQNCIAMEHIWYNRKRGTPYSIELVDISVSFRDCRYDMRFYFKKRGKVGTGKKGKSQSFND